MKRLILTLMFAVLLIGSVSALESLGTFKQNQIVRVTQVCSDATYINISSVSYPNSTVAVSGIEMTSAGSGEYYYDFGSTSLLGRYDVRGISDGCEETFATYFDVTPSGFAGTLGFYFIILGIGAGLILLGFKIEDNWIVVLGGFAVVFVGLFITFYGIDVIKDTVYTYALGIIVGMTGSYFSIRGAYEALYA